METDKSKKTRKTYLPYKDPTGKSMPDSDWIINKLESAGHKRADLAKALNVERGLITLLLQGKRMWKYQDVVRAASFIGVDLKEMLEKCRLPVPRELRLADNQKDIQTPAEPSNIAPGPAILHRVPVLSFVQAGEWGGAEELEPEEWIICASKVGPRAFALRVTGPSMESEFTAGDYIVVDPDRPWGSGDYVVAKNGDEEATFKQYFKDGERNVLAPRNKEWGAPMDMTGQRWRIIGRVVEKVKKY